MSDYMMDLRKLVGSRPIFQNGASVIVINEKNQLLMGLRADNHCWGYAGGSIELGENLEEAGARELYEEFAITANKLDFFGVFSGKELYYKYPNGDEVYNIDSVFICRDFEGIPQADGHELTEARWFDMDQLPENISPPIVMIIEKFVKEFKGTLM
mgnify:CR=1 FL=1